MPTEAYALCPMPYALCPVVPHVSEKGYMSETNNIINPPPRTRQTRIYIFWMRSNIRLIWVIGCVGAGLQDCLRFSNIVGKTRPYRMREHTTPHEHDKPESTFFGCDRTSG
jgi:hypothetical protein